jgi:hypothetical protein
VAIEVRQFLPYHVDLLKAQGVQDAQIAEVSLVLTSYANVSRPDGPAVTVFDGDRIVICGGIAKVTESNGVCWALLSADAGKHMTWLHYAVKRFITLNPWRRLEATVEENFEDGCRWVKLLGFEFEGRMAKYGPNGETHLRYSRT